MGTHRRRPRPSISSIRSRSTCISADVPLITGTNLNEAVSGLDRPDADAMTVEELNRLVSEAFGRDSEAIIAAYRQDYPESNSIWPLRHYRRLSVSHPGIRRRPSGKPPWARRRHTLTFMRGGPRYWITALAHSMPLKSHLCSTMPSFAITTAQAIRALLFCRSR